MSQQQQLTDQAARERALDPAHSFIVQAPAGSGKTELLTQRFLVLLNYVKTPEEILAITFTKKSSHEMRARIINTLKKADESEIEPTSAHAKKTWKLAKNVLLRDKSLNWNLISNPNRLRIQTIDSFNVSLTKYLPIVSQFGATPEITDDPTLLYRETVQEFLSHLEENVAWGEAIEKLLLHTDNDLTKVESLLIALLAKRDQWLPHITLNSQNPDLKIQLETYLQHVIQEAIDEVVNLFPQSLIDETLTLARFAGHNLLRSGANSKITNLLNTTQLDEANLAEWLGVAELLLTNDNNWRKSYRVNNGFPADKTPDCIAMKERINILISQFIEKDKLQNALTNLRSLPNDHYNDAQWTILEALHIVLKIVVALLRLTFKKYGKIDYIENAQAALTALGTEDEPTDIALALDYRIQHILVDEFQDTASTQYRLLEKLTAGWQAGDGRTLFVVGDPMQSIYRFREAEVGLFIRARQQGLNQLYLEPLTLEVNFRSTPQIVEWVNAHFKTVLPKNEDIGTGAVTYSPSVSQMSLQSDTEADSSVTLHALPQTEQKREQANRIVELIQQAKTKDPTGSIAILVRTRTHLKTIIPALKAANLAYRAIDIDPLSMRPVIQDLMALTRALLHPTDRIAWLSVLRAPFIGLTLEDLLLLTDNANASLLANLQIPEIITTLSTDGQARLARTLPIILNRVNERYRFTLRMLIESTWLLLGGPATLDESTDLEDAAAYFKLLEKIDSTNHFIEADQLERLVERLYATPEIDNENPLQIMTIHNAKGLEFDTVIIPQLDRKSAGDDKQLLLWMERPRSDESSDLLMAPINAIGDKDDAIYQYIKLQIKQKLKFEMGRLLYVAVTRAKKHLHLLFSLKELDKNPEANSLLGELWPAIKHQLTALPALNTQLSDTDKLHVIRPFKRITTAWQSPIQEVKDTKQISFHKNKAGFSLPDDKPRLIGTLLHEILNQFAKLGSQWWTSQSTTAQTQYLNQQLIRTGLPNAEMAYAIKMLQQGIQNILTDDRGKWILANHAESAAEFPISTVINNEVHSLVIDRTFVDDQGIRWIIDYKTTIFTPTDLNTFLNDKQKLHEKQLWQYQQAIQQIDSRPIRLALYFPMIPAWHSFSTTEELSLT